LCTLLAGSSAPLDVDLADTGSVLGRLSETEREWLSDVGARLLVPILGEQAALVGVMVLGEKRSELPFSGEDRMLLSAVAASAAFALESRLHAETPGRARASDITVEDQQPARQCARCGQVAREAGERCTLCDGPLRDAMLPAVVDGKFALERQIGAGGMGVVYRATDLELGRAVALKTLPRVSPEDALRLRREARAMASLEHPNLAIIHGYDAWRGIPILVLEYLHGGTLHDRLNRAPLAPRDAIEMGAAIADALEHLHRRGLLHRDVKPRNIGYTADGVPKLLDFGLVHLAAQLSRSTVDDTTATGIGWVWREHSLSGASAASIGMAGTPAYLSPEALKLRPPDPSFDLWSLGVTLYEAVAGVNPFRATQASDVFALIQRAAPRDVREFSRTCPPGLASFLARALALDPAERPASAAEFRKVLRSIA
jgi:serine/threonine protein kinase